MLRERIDVVISQTSGDRIGEPMSDAYPDIECNCASGAVPLESAVFVAVAGNNLKGHGLRRQKPLRVRRSARRPLWQLSPQHHCTLLGGAFCPQELRNMFRQVRQVNWKTDSDFELHSAAVSLARERNEFSRGLQRALEQRFASTVIRFGAAGTANEVLDLWRTLARQGEAISAY